MQCETRSSAIFNGHSKNNTVNLFHPNPVISETLFGITGELGEVPTRWIELSPLKYIIKKGSVENIYTE